MVSKSNHRSFTRLIPGMAGLAMLLVAAITFFSPTVVHALPSNEVDTEYYSDSTYTDLVGESILSCNGTRWSWGVKTVYKIVYSFPCFSGGGGVSSSNKAAPFVGPAESFLAAHGDGGGAVTGCGSTTPGA